ncbi:J domain-containing protein [Variovorax paradoxus]|nr:J domain-containing protein [Variovorax paradoxus]
MNATAFPLSWPATIPRSQEREKGKFQTTLAGALKNVDTSLQRFANDSGKDLTNIVISSNVTLGVQRPEDPGVAVWFTWDGLGLCIPVDRYSSVEGNLQAIHHIIEARRVELRHGTLALVRATFQGFKALPKPAGTDWWHVLGVKSTATAVEIDAAYKRLASQHHPDKGGSTEKMSAINAAREAALKERQ